MRQSVGGIFIVCLCVCGNGLPVLAESPWADVEVGQSGHQASARTHTATAILPVRTGGPLLNSYLAPSNIALRVQGTASMVLPPTRLDSFIAGSGYDDSIYGDESDSGPPPYSSFNTIESGIRNSSSASDLTTGHASDAPPASGGLNSGPSPAALQQKGILVSALTDQGLDYEQSGDLAAAERLLSMAVALDPYNQNAAQALARINPQAQALANAQAARTPSGF